MIGYKAFDENLCCRGFQFEVGKTYETDASTEEMKLYTGTVFHFCRELHQIEFVSIYRLSESRICEVISGDVITDKDRRLYGTNKLTILREIVGDEKDALINTGKCNTGYCNAGDCNTGNCNTGDCNTGNCNSGIWNAGNCNGGSSNTGNHNIGNYNTSSYNIGNYNAGKHNAGNYNIGAYNIGNCNVGNYNTGDWNTGKHNAGNYNTGAYNIGYWNTGCWNTGCWNTGFFNTGVPTIRMFNKDTELLKEDVVIPDFMYFDLVVWVPYNTATDEEKQQYRQEIEVTGGYLKELDYQEAFRMSWDKVGVSEHKKLLALPNWDNKIFKEIFGIDAEAEIAKEEASENQ